MTHYFLKALLLFISLRKATSAEPRVWKQRGSYNHITSWPILTSGNLLSNIGNIWTIIKNLKCIREYFLSSYFPASYISLYSCYEIAIFVSHFFSCFIARVIQKPGKLNIRSICKYDFEIEHELLMFASDQLLRSTAIPYNLYSQDFNMVKKYQILFCIFCCRYQVH